MKEIVEIAVEKIKPNPANPRLDLGDLTELAASIRENGIMQILDGTHPAYYRGGDHEEE